MPFPDLFKRSLTIHTANMETYDVRDTWDHHLNIADRETVTDIADRLGPSTLDVPCAYQVTAAPDSRHWRLPSPSCLHPDTADGD